MNLKHWKYCPCYSEMHCDKAYKIGNKLMDGDSDTGTIHIIESVATVMGENGPEETYRLSDKCYYRTAAVLDEKFRRVLSVTTEA